ncbi:hypothetical protein ABZ942_21595 [Nocardia sp. NPDC046473]|uniref:hypothetical protein n=1 Tax=Nocardia sp. NPDC046473 TaxID=3155733 RepID=UPI0033E8CD09
MTAVRWICTPALVAGAFTAVSVPAHAAELPSICKSAAGTITCDGDLKDGDTVEGTGGDDTIVIKGNVPQGAVVRGGGGNDTISAYDVGTFICNGGIGASAGKGGEIDGGEGDDTITVGGGKRSPECEKKFAGIDIPLGNVSERGKVSGGPGNDKISVGTLGYVKSDQDHPELSLEVIAGRVDGGTGDDTIDVGWVATGATFDNPATADGVYGGEGNDTIHAGDVNGLGLVSGGPGRDTLTVDGMNTGEVDGDEGDDVINVTYINGPDGEIVMPGYNAGSADGGPGNDTITVEMIGRTGGVFGDDGNDTITVKSLNGPEDPISGDGDELKWHAGIINGWDGNDKITVGLVGKMGQVWGDGYPDAPVKGKDIIKVTDLNDQAKIRGGPLADVITVTNINSKQASVNGEGGNDKITVTGKNAGTVIGGAGSKDTCKAKGAKKTCELPAKKKQKQKK